MGDDWWSDPIGGSIKVDLAPHVLKRPLIVGAKGGMGRRYTAVLRREGVEPLLMDLGDEIPQGFDSVLICTPTASHVTDICRFAAYKVPILCEKPISTDLDEALGLCDFAERNGVLLRMVNQYRYMIAPGYRGGTAYNFYNHGKDGIAWDCISLIALASGAVQLEETSPTWICTINGQHMRQNWVDWSYVHMIRGWLQGDLCDIPYIREAHAKVAAYLETHGEDSDRNSGEVRQHEAS